MSNNIEDSVDEEPLDETLKKTLLELAYNFRNSKTDVGKLAADEAAQKFMESVAHEKYGDNSKRIQRFTGAYLLFYRDAKENPSLLPPSMANPGLE